MVKVIQGDYDFYFKDSGSAEKTSFRNTVIFLYFF